MGTTRVPCKAEPRSRCAVRTRSTRAPGSSWDTADVCVLIIADDTDNIDDTVGDRDGTPGEFLLGGLVLGRYTVDETIAPPGFEPDPAVRTVDLTIANPNAVIATAFVNNRPILKINGIRLHERTDRNPDGRGGERYHDVHRDDPELRWGDGDVRCQLSRSHRRQRWWNVQLHTSSPLELTRSIAPGAANTVTVSTTCTYSGFDDGSHVSASLNISYILNGLTRVASGSPATITFTVQAD